MANTFTLTIPAGTDVTSAIAEVKNGIEAKKGTFTFDGTMGVFSVSGVTGYFTLKVRQVTITINKKPFIVSHEYVQKAISAYFV